MHVFFPTGNTSSRNECHHIIKPVLNSLSRKPFLLFCSICVLFWRWNMTFLVTMKLFYKEISFFKRNVNAPFLVKCCFDSYFKLNNETVLKFNFCRWFWYLWKIYRSGGSTNTHGANVHTRILIGLKKLKMNA